VDYRLEQVIDGTAGHHAALDAVMRDTATWGAGLRGRSESARR
jgi:hypothetical protein